MFTQLYIELKFIFPYVARHWLVISAPYLPFEYRYRLTMPWAISKRFPFKFVPFTCLGDIRNRCIPRLSLYDYVMDCPTVLLSGMETFQIKFSLYPFDTRKLPNWDWEESNGVDLKTFQVYKFKLCRSETLHFWNLWF